MTRCAGCADDQRRLQPHQPHQAAFRRVQVVGVVCGACRVYRALSLSQQKLLRLRAFLNKVRGEKVVVAYVKRGVPPVWRNIQHVPRLQHAGQQRVRLPLQLQPPLPPALQKPLPDVWCAAVRGQIQICVLQQPLRKASASLDVLQAAGSAAPASASRRRRRAACRRAATGTTASHRAAPAQRVTRYCWRVQL